MNVRAEWSAIDEAQLHAVAVALAQSVGAGGTLFLEGDLGAGKTTFARALLGALGVGERIKSPTYSLIESYQVGDLRIHHLDLYRIAGADELHWLGLADLLDGPSLLVVEWPERGTGALPEADLRLQLSHRGDRRDLVALPASGRGAEWISRLPA